MTETNKTEDGMTPEDMADAELQANVIIDGDKNRYKRVMEEIDKDEKEALERLRKIRIRRAAVIKAGHYGR